MTYPGSVLRLDYYVLDATGNEVAYTMPANPTPNPTIDFAFVYLFTFDSYPKNMPTSDKVNNTVEDPNLNATIAASLGTHVEESLTVIPNATPGTTVVATLGNFPAKLSLGVNLRVRGRVLTKDLHFTLNNTNGEITINSTQATQIGYPFSNSGAGNTGDEVVAVYNY